MDIIPFFTEARNILDAHHDRRERVIKVSRDITAQSKKMVFALHRAAQKGGNYKEAKLKQEEIMGLFRQLAPEVAGTNYYRYARSFSGGFEEFIEGVAFLHYLEHTTMIKKEEIDKLFQDEDGDQWLYVRAEDYVLGIADFTGELMRYAINIITNGNYDQALQICRFLRQISTDCEILAGSSLPQLGKKMGALRSTCYAFQIRGSEYPKEMYQQIIRDVQSRHEDERPQDD
ncbi:Translin [Zychaea mexicana]|uniref:Translin n=1 Tax=Zychaea mexicana TaxID=64656 RepID=UPI0022FEE1C2|nr:Translin [Zychaea mexicana]KAI9496679.1 Translin [Zychaea mexicana]